MPLSGAAGECRSPAALTILTVAHRYVMMVIHHNPVSQGVCHSLRASHNLIKAHVVDAISVF